LAVCCCWQSRRLWPAGTGRGSAGSFLPQILILGYQIKQLEVPFSWGYQTQAGFAFYDTMKSNKKINYFKNTNFMLKWALTIFKSACHVK
jgi:hypothetical protein